MAKQISLFLCLAVVLVLAACAGKDDVTPVDVEGQAFDDLRAEIRAVVEDPDSEAEAIRLVGVLQTDLATLRSSVAERSRRLKVLNADYDTTRAEFDEFLEITEAQVRDNRQRVTETHQAFLDAVNAEERAQIDKLRSKAISAAIRSIQSI